MSFEQFAEETNNSPNETAVVAKVGAILRWCVGRIGRIRCVGYVVYCCSATVATIVIIAVDVSESRNLYRICVAAGTSKSFNPVSGAGRGGCYF